MAWPGERRLSERDRATADRVLKMMAFLLGTHMLRVAWDEELTVEEFVQELQRMAAGRPGESPQRILVSHLVAAATAAELGAWPLVRKLMGWAEELVDELDPEGAEEGE